jgi:hypothetical protein
MGQGVGMPTLSVLPLLRQPPRLLKGSFCIAQEHRDNALNTVGVGMPTPSTARHPKSELDALPSSASLATRGDDDSDFGVKDWARHHR